MGCKQTTTKSPSVVIATSPTTSSNVKSALKKSHVKGGEKTEKPSFLKQNVPTLNKSVNFDEKVQVKLRTPTPRERQYEKASSKKIVQRQIYHNDKDNDDDDDDEVTSISSQEDNINNEPIKISKPVPSQFLQRNQSNAFWNKNNSIGIISGANNVKEKSQLPPTAIQQPHINMTTNSTENSNMPIGNRFRIRRKVQYPVLPQASSPVVSIQSPTTSSSPPIVQTSSPTVQRSLPNTNAILIEHHASFSDGGSTPNPTYYAFKRRPIDKPNSTEK